ncbi:MAG: hypothetical protein U0269_32530 [Polyangiales bacterium]
MAEEQKDTVATAEDEYVAKYMEGGDALAIAKKRMPWWWFVLLSVPAGGMALAGIVGAIAGTVPIPGVILTLLLSVFLMGFMTLLFSHLRTVVTDHALHIQLGLWGPKIPLEKITAIKAAMYDWKKYGGWGIRWGRDGSICYSVPGGTGECVEVEWTNPSGKTVKHVVSVDNAASIVSAVERARSAIAAGATGVRVESSSVESAGDLESVEASASNEAASRKA